MDNKDIKWLIERKKAAQNRAAQKTDPCSDWYAEDAKHYENILDIMGTMAQEIARLKLMVNIKDAR